ncbi:MAG: ATP-binding cassette domain-containing protein [Gammaproteobacteria bacterium]|nr:MAG: ATP-binding cassette domain-containing protein [Gammaproteobacteria bacterium]
MNQSSLLSAQAVRLANQVSVTLEVSAGEIIFIHGPSGSGKTLLLRALADLDEHQGDIYLNKARQSDIKPTDWRHKVGYLAGESAWWEETVGNHFPAEISISMASLQLPDNIVNASIQNLSIGEKQRLALLRLLNHQPDILLLDEPTANLDQSNIHYVETLIREYIKDQHRAAVWVSHDLQQAKRLGYRSYEMTPGGLIEAGI